MTNQVDWNPRIQESQESKNKSPIGDACRFPMKFLDSWIPPITKTAETEMESIPEIINGLPNISGWEDWVRQTTARGGTVYLGRTPMRPERIQSAFAVALHMHQPVILYNHDLRTAPMVSNLQY